MSMTKKKYTHLRRILFFSFSSIFFAASVSGLFLYLLHYKDAKKSEEKNCKALSTSIAAQIDKEIDEAQKKLELIASFPAFLALPHVDKIDLKLNGLPENIDSEKRQILEMLREKSDFSVLFVLKPNGDHYISHPFAVQQNLRKDRYNLSGRPYFKEARRTKSPVISDSFLGADGILAVAIDVPVLNKDDDIVAHVGGVFHLTSLSKLVAKERISKFDLGFVVDRQGNGIAHTNMDLVMSDVDRKKFSDHPLLKAFDRSNFGQLAFSEDGEVFTHEFFNPLDGERYYGSVAPLNTGWKLVLLCSMQKIVSELKTHVIAETFFVSLLFLLLSSLGVVFVHSVGGRWQKAEFKLSESERLLREAQRVANLGHWELDLRSNSLVWSDEIYRIFGLQPQEFMATYEAFIERVHPDDRDAVDSTYKESVELKTEYKIEHRILLEDDTEKWVLERGQTEYDDAGTPVRSFGTVQDITELKLLRGILPICSACKKIRDDEGYWNHIESYFYKYSDAEFSHSICPGCAQELYPQEYEAIYGSEETST
jgi:PAS domain S-box-containing protein